MVSHLCCHLLNLLKVELNKELQLKNAEYRDLNKNSEKFEEILKQREFDLRTKDEMLTKKDKIIKELQRLIEIYESQIHTKEHLKEADQMEEEIPVTESREIIVQRYSKISYSIKIIIIIR